MMRNCVLKKVSIYMFVLLGLLLIGIPGNCLGQETDSLAVETAKGILTYFSEMEPVRTSIIKYENFSILSDSAAHKFYQVLISNLEQPDNAQFHFTDLMVNFYRKRGEFNLSRINNCNYLIYIKLITKKNKLGCGLSIFSRSLDRIVYVDYFQQPFSLGDRDIYETRDYGFNTTGFSKQVEMEAEKHLLDFKSIDVPGGESRYFFYYPEKIEIFRDEANRIKRFNSFPLEWGRPYYPAMEPEGRLSLFYLSGDDRLFLTVGSNFSSHGKVFYSINNRWQEAGQVDFVPIKPVKLNENIFLAGARYAEGKNYFKDRLILSPFVKTEGQIQEQLSKQIPFFYCIDFSTYDNKSLESIHLVDTDYNYRFFAGDFEERTVESEKRGAALAALGGKWLAISAYSSKNDTLYFYKIEEGSKRLVYQNTISGQVIFISHGSWKNKPGFWVYVKKMNANNRNIVDYSLQFWSKSNE